MYSPEKTRNDPLGIYGPAPPPPPQENLNYYEMAQKYPAMFPPGMVPPQYQAHPAQQMMPVQQTRSSFPGVAFVFSLLALVSNILFFMDFILLFLEIANDITTNEEACCLSMLALWFLSAALSFVSILLSSIAFYRVKKGRYERHKRATPSLIFSIISGATFILIHIVAVIFFVLLLGI